MRFEDFIRTGQVRRAKRDDSLAKALVKTAKEDMAFFDFLNITEKSARKIISNYYDFLRSILEAMAALDGYKIYGHEAFSFYLKEKGEVALAEKFDKFRLKRNKINYYGRLISSEEAEEMKDDIKKASSYLTSKYFGE